MTEDSFAAWEKDLLNTPLVYGSDDEVMESFNALIFAAGCFGRTATESLVTAVNDAVPMLAQIDDEGREDDVDIDYVHDKYFREDVLPATIDALAEGVKVAQVWLQSWMAAHDLKVLQVLVPTLGGKVRAYTFGVLSKVKEEFPNSMGDARRIAATSPIQPEDQGYL